jgi:archaellum biogenesis protein FlaJ (TadC family)
MSSTTAEVIDYLAEEVTDSDLRDALHRLANNGKSGSQE